MKRFLKNVFAILRKTNDNKAAARPERLNPTPFPKVQSCIKAGSYANTGGPGTGRG
jgi:hypothetical protein